MKDDEVLALSRSVLGAIDRRDIQALRSIVAPGFALLENGRELNLDFFAGAWKKKRPPRSRQCRNQRVFRKQGILVYVAQCVEKQPATDDGPGKAWHGWNSIAIAPVDGEWKPIYWQWFEHSTESIQRFWDGEFVKGTVFSKKPTEFLVTTAKALKPGRALVLAMGQGRNALYLASVGWEVTGVDISEVGIEQAKAEAARRGLTLHAEHADIDTYDFGRQRWDLVTMFYTGPYPHWIPEIKKGMAPGGSLVIETFHRAADAPEGDGHFNSDELAGYFQGDADWEIVKNEVVDGVSDWYPNKTKLIRFIARRRNP